MRITNSLLVILSIVISIMMISSVVYSGLASGQVYGQGYYGSQPQYARRARRLPDNPGPGGSAGLFTGIEPY